MELCWSFFCYHKLPGLVWMLKRARCYGLVIFSTRAWPITCSMHCIPQHESVCWTLCSDLWKVYVCVYIVCVVRRQAQGPQKSTHGYNGVGVVRKYGAKGVLSIPNLKEAVPRASGHSRAIFCYSQTANTVVMSSQHTCKQRHFLILLFSNVKEWKQGKSAGF